MSALTEKVAREHQRVFNAKFGFGPHCTCGWVHPRYDGPQKHVQHVAAVTEAATRAAVAAEIRAEYERPPAILAKAQRAAWKIGIARAHGIAKRKQP